MPLQQCSKNGKSGWKWGESGFCYPGLGGRVRALRQARAIKANSVRNALHGHPRPRIDPLRADPSRTATLRRVFEEEMRRRFNRVRRAMRNLIEVEDAFGLKDPKFLTSFTGNLRGYSKLAQGAVKELVHQVGGNPSVPALNTRWRFNTTPQQVQLFNIWIATELGTTVTDLSTIEQDRYWQRFVEDGYRKGAGRAFDDTRRPALATSKAQLDFYKGTKAEFLRSSFAQPETVDKVKLLAGRVFTELENVNSDMATRMTRGLADGLVTGSNPRTIARRMSQDLEIGKHRAERIARTEIIRAHAEGQLDAMERLGVEQINVMVEWSTAGDDRVCEMCAPMEGVVLKIQEGHGMIPRHPSCRCAFLPANVGEPVVFQKRGQRNVEEAMDRSLKAEIPKRARRSVATQRRLSPWPGAGQHIGKVRPNPLVKSQKIKPPASPIKKPIARRIPPATVDEIKGKALKSGEIPPAKFKNKKAKRTEPKLLKSESKNPKMAIVDEAINHPVMIKRVKVPDKMFHVTSRANVKTIREKGLVRGSVRASTEGESLGIYMTENFEDILFGQGDIKIVDPVIVQIDANKLKGLRLDPEFFDGGFNPSADDVVLYLDEIASKKSDWALYSRDTISPDHLTFLEAPAVGGTKLRPIK